MVQAAEEMATATVKHAVSRAEEGAEALPMVVEIEMAVVAVK